MSKDGIFADLIRSYRQTEEDRDEILSKVFSTSSGAAKEIVEELKHPPRSLAGKWHHMFTWQHDQKYEGGYFVDSTGVGTAASKRNDLDSYIFWTEQMLLKSQGKPYATGHKD